MILDVELGAKLLKCLVVELLPVIGDQHPWNAESADCGPPYKFLDVLLCDDR